MLALLPTASKAYLDAASGRRHPTAAVGIQHLHDTPARVMAGRALAATIDHPDALARVGIGEMDVGILD